MFNNSYEPLLFNETGARNTPPFYHTERPNLLAGISDPILALAAPVICYWALSLFFHCLDISEWEWLDKYRIHDSEELRTRNKATRSQVVVAVVLQQLTQTVLGVFWLNKPSQISHEEGIRKIAQALAIVVNAVLGEETGASLLATRGADMVHFTYWWGIPTAQFLFAMFFIDTWQYFLHRLMHINKFLYKHFHSVHHRLYVPYAFGSLYNHPFEGFLLDSLGAALAEFLTGMTHRQTMVLFSISTLKTVDDHCGYRLPFDPLQMVTSNNADYHDIHHQVIGIKSNFSQPFFVHWDALLGTRMTRKDIEKRRDKVHEKTI